MSSLTAIKRSSYLAASAIAAVFFSNAAQEKAGYEAMTPEARFRSLSREFNRIAQAWRQAEADERTALLARLEVLPLQVLELTRAHPQDPFVLDALTDVISLEYWINAYTSHAGWGEESPQAAAIAILLREHLNSDKLGAACKRAQFGFRQECEDFLRSVVEKSPHRDVRGLACLRLAEFLAIRHETLALLEDQPDLASRYELVFGKEYMRRLRAQDRAKAMQEVEALYERAGEQFGDVTNPDSGTVGERVKTVLYEIRQLAIGREAPDITGQDQDGVPFKLSDYRGKVVLVYFWSEY